MATSQPAQPSAAQRPTEDTEPKPLRRPATRSWRIQVETEANRLELDLQTSIDALPSGEKPRYEVIDEIRWQLFRRAASPGTGSAPTGRISSRPASSRAAGCT